MKQLHVLCITTLALALTGCGGGLSGTYTDSNNIMRFEFHSNGTVDVENTIAGQVVEANYDVQDDKVVLTVDGKPPAVLRKKNGEMYFHGKPLRQL